MKWARAHCDSTYCPRNPIFWNLPSNNKTAALCSPTLVDCHDWTKLLVQLLMYTRGASVQSCVANGKDMHGALVTGSAQVLRIVAEIQAAHKQCEYVIHALRIKKKGNAKPSTCQANNYVSLSSACILPPQHSQLTSREWQGPLHVSTPPTSDAWPCHIFVSEFPKIKKSVETYSKWNYCTNNL